MISGLTSDSVVESAADLALEVRKAGMGDIAPLLRLINDYAAKGIMLPRTEFEMSENIRDFSVIYSGEELIGCGALHFYSPIMGEVRSLAVDPKWKAHGVGRRMVEALVAEAGLFSIDAVFAFTYVPDFFRRMEFAEVERGELPLKAWKDCMRCPKFQCCDEIAMVRILRPEHWRNHHQSVQQGDEGTVLLPIVMLSSGVDSKENTGENACVTLSLRCPSRSLAGLMAGCRCLQDLA